MARSTVAQRVELLLAHRLVYEAGESASTGGRRPTLLAFNQAAGVVLVADLGATPARVAVSDLAGTPLVEESHRLEIADGPERALSWLDDRFAALLRALGRSDRDVRGIGRGSARCRGLRRRPAREPPGHAGVGRLLDPALVRRPPRRARARRQRRERHGARRALDALARLRADALRQGGHRHRLRDHLRTRDGSPRRAGRRRRHRPHPGPGPRRRALPLRQRRLPGGGRRRQGARGAPRRSTPVAGHAGRRPARASRRPRGRAGRPGGGPSPRGRARELREPLQSQRDRRSEETSPRPSSCWPASGR